MATDSAERAREALARVRGALAAHATDDVIELRIDGDRDTAVVPREAIELLARVLASMSSGQAVSVISRGAELTSQQAADLLNVSRPYLIGLLDQRAIPYRKVGTHRRIRLDDLLGYQRRDDAERRAVADELTRLAQEMGLSPDGPGRSRLRRARALPVEGGSIESARNPRGDVGSSAGN